MAWVDSSVLEISRRHSFLARSAMQETECLKRTLKAIEVMNDSELLHQFTHPSTPIDPCDPAEDHHIKELFARFDTDKVLCVAHSRSLLPHIVGLFCRT